ncbi:MAG TPA: hypothetical protein DEB05_15775, partial [Firmicutes bacterium]|nr:hypothetical protein [Bacillota bacterium]
RTFEIMSKRLDGIQTEKADLVLSPEVGKVGTVQFYRAEECIEKGEIAAREALPEIKRVLEEFQYKKEERAEYGA